MTKTIKDQVSGVDVSIRLVGNKASMTANGNFIETTISPADLSMAKVALSKRDLNSFGSFFDRAEHREAA